MDESAYLGSAVNAEFLPKEVKAVKEKKQVVAQAKKQTKDLLAPAADRLLEIIEHEIEKKDKASTVRSDSTRYINLGLSIQEAYGVALLANKDQCDFLLKIKHLLVQAKREAEGEDEDE